ncbi:MAG: class I SAM-dependent RNA methyltransferase [Paludibacteraceae bacterium]|nr:class I SAM-dependent RNA methyltransferase [Paludibacteraceae bacterium]
MAEKFEMVAKTFQGLEGVLAKELIDLGAENVQEVRRGVTFEGDKKMLYMANFFCRTALRVLKPIYTFEAESADEVYEKVKAFDWDEYLDDRKTFAIDATVFSDVFRHSQFLQYRVKDAIADRFMEKIGKRPSVRLTNPDLYINIHVADRTCTISLDSSGESLHKRGYRVAQTAAPINEVLAAGMLLMADWNGQSDFIDPMCGSGTILVEAAMIAKGIAPGLYREKFAFQTWKDYDADMFDEIFQDDSREKEFDYTIYGSDILRSSIEIAEKNVTNAGLASYVKLTCIPFQELNIPEGDAMIMFNPPYGERIGGGDDLPTLYAEIGKKLKEDCTGKNAWIITVPNEATSQIRLSPSFKVALKNGDIDCEFRKYEMFSGRREDYVRDGKERRFKEREEREKEDKERRENREENEFFHPMRRKYVDEDGKDLRESDRLAYLRRRHEEQEARAEREKRWAEKKEYEQKLGERKKRFERDSEGDGEERRERRDFRGDSRGGDRGERRGGFRGDRRDGDRRDGDRGERRDFHRDGDRDDKRSFRGERRNDRGDRKDFRRDRRDDDDRDFRRGGRDERRGERRDFRKGGRDENRGGGRPHKSKEDRFKGTKGNFRNDRRNNDDLDD